MTYPRQLNSFSARNPVQLLLNSLFATNSKNFVGGNRRLIAGYNGPAFRALRASSLTSVDCPFPSASPTVGIAADRTPMATLPTGQILGCSRVYNQYSGIDWIQVQDAADGSTTAAGGGPTLRDSVGVDLGLLGIQNTRGHQRVAQGVTPSGLTIFTYCDIKVTVAFTSHCVVCYQGAAFSSPRMGIWDDNVGGTSMNGVIQNDTTGKWKEQRTTKPNPAAMTLWTYRADFSGSDTVSLWKNGVLISNLVTGGVYVDLATLPDLPIQWAYAAGEVGTLGAGATFRDFMVFYSALSDADILTLNNYLMGLP